MNNKNNTKVSYIRCKFYNLNRKAVCIILCTIIFNACERDLPDDTEIDNDMPPLFTEIAEQSGLIFHHFLGATGEYHFPELAGVGLAIFDYDNDGDLDIYMLQGHMLDENKSINDASFPPPATHFPGNRLYQNRLIPDGHLRFEDVTEQAGVGLQGYGMGVAVGDTDNDGDQDIYVTNFRDNVFYRNNNDGTLTDITADSRLHEKRWSASAAFFDYDLDSDLDLFVTNYVDFTVKGAKACSGATGQVEYCGPKSYKAVPDRLFRNDGDNNFTNVTFEAGIHAAYGSGLGVVAADFNNDGYPDIYVANDLRANQLWMNQRNGTFKDLSLMSGTAFNANGKAEAGMGVTAADFDNDGDEDLYMTHLVRETNTLYLNDGRGNFYDATNQFKLAQPSVPNTGFGTRWFDYDNDGDLDIFIANGAVNIEASQKHTPYPYRQKNQLLENVGNGDYRDISATAGPALQY